MKKDLNDDLKNDMETDRKKRHPLSNIALVTQLGISIATPILLGLYLGDLLDAKFEKNGLFTVILLVLGAVTGILNLIKMTYPKNKEK